MPQSSLVAARSYAPHSAIHHTARLMLQRKSHAGAQRVTQRVASRGRHNLESLSPHAYLLFEEGGGQDCLHLGLQLLNHRHVLVVPKIGSVGSVGENALLLTKT